MGAIECMMCDGSRTVSHMRIFCCHGCTCEMQGQAPSAWIYTYVYREDAVQSMNSIDRPVVMVHCSDALPLVIPGKCHRYKG
jgi:hypothetical protein